MLRLAQADVLPFEFKAPAAAIGAYVDEVEKLATRMRTETERHNRPSSAARSRRWRRRTSGA